VRLDSQKGNVTLATVTIGKKSVGDGCPVYVIAEIGINHNGDIAIAKKLIDVAAEAGCDAVKFQKRTPELCVPRDQWDIMRDTPWGRMSYIEYRRKIEFGPQEFEQIDRHCAERKIDWFTSCWDAASVEFIMEFKPICLKVASAMLTNSKLLRRYRDTGLPVILSTGMSSFDQIRMAVDRLDPRNLLLAHCTSTYPCPKSELNLRMIGRLKQEFPVPVGYSGHEVGLATTVAAVALGATFVERHITLDRAMWGSDQAASIEPIGLRRLVKDIRNVEDALGDGVKRVYDSEMPALKRLRYADDLGPAK
jgi:N-acetylneuraminate synthase